MASENPYETPIASNGDATLTGRDLLICSGLAMLMWLASAGVMAAFVFGLFVAFAGPYSASTGALSSPADGPGRSVLGIAAGVISVIATSLATPTFFRVQQSRRRAGASAIRRAELVRAVAHLHADLRRRKTTEGRSGNPAADVRNNGD